MKKIIGLIMVAVLCLSIGILPASADVSAEQYSTQRLLHEKLDEYYQLYGDIDLAAEKFEENYEHFHLISSDFTTGPNASTRSSNEGYINMYGHVWYNDELQYYYYYARWDWNKDVPSNEGDPWDVIMITTSLPDELWLENFIVKASGDGQYAQYTSHPYSKSGSINLRDSDNGYGVFVLDEKKLTGGSISSKLGYTDFNTSATVKVQYHHAWSAEDINGYGFGFDISETGLGFTYNVSWDNVVNSWYVSTVARHLKDVNV